MNALADDSITKAEAAEAARGAGTADLSSFAGSGSALLVMSTALAGLADVASLESPALKAYPSGSYLLFPPSLQLFTQFLKLKRLHRTHQTLPTIPIT